MIQTILIILFMILDRMWLSRKNQQNLDKLKEEHSIEVENLKREIDGLKSELSDAVSVNRTLVNEGLRKHEEAEKRLKKKNQTLSDTVTELNREIDTQKHRFYRLRDDYRDKLDAAYRGKVYRFTVRDENEDFSFPRSIIVIAASEDFAAKVLINQMNDIFGELKICHILSMYKVEQISREKDSIVLTNMDVF